MKQAQTVVVLSLFPVCGVWAQQPPNPLYTTEQFDTNASFRQNVCERQALLHRGMISLSDALEGLELRTLILQNEFLEIDNETGGLNEDYPGLVAELLDEIALRGKFTWRDSYALTENPVLNGRNWTELLTWSTKSYDLSVDWWIQTTDRMSLGVSFPEGWYDASIIMVGDVSDKEKIFNFFSFLRPFSSEVWLVIIATCFLSGIVYWLLRLIDDKTDEDHLLKSPIENIYVASLGFTGQFDFQPRTRAARIFTFSMAFWVMLSTAAYTANLASFLVVENKPKLQVNSLAEAVKNNMKLCIAEGMAHEKLVTTAFPIANLVRYMDEKEAILGLNNKECDIAVTPLTSWDIYERDAEAHSGCNLAWIGRTFRSQPAGFATKSDSGTFCTSLIRDVVNLHLKQMKEDGSFNDIWDRFLSQTSTINCGAGGESEAGGGGDAQQLDLPSMLGSFCLHYAMCFLSLSIAAWYKFIGKVKKSQNVDKEGPGSGFTDEPLACNKSTKTSQGANLLHLTSDVSQIQSDVSQMQNDVLAIKNQMQNEMLSIKSQLCAMNNHMTMLLENSERHPHCDDVCDRKETKIARRHDRQFGYI